MILAFEAPYQRAGPPRANKASRMAVQRSIRAADFVTMAQSKRVFGGERPDQQLESLSDDMCTKTTPLEMREEELGGPRKGSC